MAERVVERRFRPEPSKRLADQASTCSRDTPLDVPERPQRRAARRNAGSRSGSPCWRRVRTSSNHARRRVTGHGPCHSTPTRRQPGRPDNARSTSAQVVTAAPPPPADRSGSRSPILDALAKAGVAFVALKENIRVEGKSNIQTKVMTTLFALFAEVERDLISERTREALPGPGPRAGGSVARKGSLGVFTARRQGGPKSSASSSWVKPSP